MHRNSTIYATKHKDTYIYIHADFITGSWLDHGELMVDGRTDSSTMADHMMRV